MISAIRNYFPLFWVISFLYFVMQWVFFPENQRSLIIGIVVLLVLSLNQMIDFKTRFTALPFSKMSFAKPHIWIRMGVILSIFGMLNYLIYKNDHYWDMTGHLTNTLSDETTEVLQKVKDPVQFTIVSSPEQRSEIIKFVKIR